jgi:hypothetical protein
MKGNVEMAHLAQLGALPFQFLKTLYLFGKSDIPAAALPSVYISASTFLDESTILANNVARWL